MRIYSNLAIVVMVITGFIFGVSFATLYAQTHISEGTACSCTLPIPILIPTFSSLGVFVGSLVYSMMFSKMKEREVETKKELINFLDILPFEEREFLKIIIENNGEITQSKLSKNFGKVKSFRVLENLKRRKVIEKEKYGKTNIIRLGKKYKDIFF